MRDQLTDDKPHDECGVFGVFGSPEAARTTYFGLFALQHRGQESAGIASSDGGTLRFYKDMGLVAQVFTEDILQQLVGSIACGHNRYSTTGSSVTSNAQPVFADCDLGRIFVCHNGNLTNTPILRRIAEEHNITLHTTSDSELVAVMICLSQGDTWREKILAALPKLIGAFSLVLMTREEMFAVRDPIGVRPLSIGKSNGSWLISSESCALKAVGSDQIGDVEPGEMVSFGPDGMKRERYKKQGRRLCLFEYIYLARPGSRIDGTLVYKARYEMGRRLARLHPAKADMVIGVPNTALPAAQGFALESGIPYRDGLEPNRYITRTFIQPNQRMRKRSAQMKFNALDEILEGQRVAVVDDSIVRGTSQKEIVSILRKAGVKEIHLRITAPPLRHPCFLGVDMATYGELVAHRLGEVEAIREELGVESLGFLTLDEALDATEQKRSSLCGACFNGDYPVPVQLGFERTEALVSV